MSILDLNQDITKDYLKDNGWWPKYGGREWTKYITITKSIHKIVIEYRYRFRNIYKAPHHHCLIISSKYYYSVGSWHKSLQTFKDIRTTDELNVAMNAAKLK